jgi:hypothetical protein
MTLSPFWFFSSNENWENDVLFVSLKLGDGFKILHQLSSIFLGLALDSIIIYKREIIPPLYVCNHYSLDKLAQDGKNEPSLS